MGLEDKRTRRIELARHGDFQVRRQPDFERAASLILQTCQVCFQTIERLSATFDRAKLLGLLTSFDRVEHHLHGQASLTPEIVERGSYVEESWMIATVIAMQIDKPLRGFNLEEDNLIWIVGSIRAVHHVPPD